MTIEPENKSALTAKRALRALQELQIKLAAIEAARHEPIAIIGMGCRLPGANNLSDFWEMLCQGRTGITEVPPERWDVDAYFSADPKARGKVSSRWGGFVPGVELFDAHFFGISPREAAQLDPRQRLMLEVTWEALEDSGIPPHSLSGSQTGVFVAALSNDYDSLICEDFTRMDSFTGTGTANSIVANRISYFLDLRGPSIALDTACSGSLLTIELACRSLRSGESSLALAGGVSVNLLPKGDLFFSRAGALSPDGKCQTFDRRANGIVRGEGAGVVALKPLSKALADGDRIYSVIRGGAINHDGRSNGIMAPNGLAQEAMLQEAYRNAGVSPAEVQFVETHGTGTPLGDPIEVKALGNVLGSERRDDLPCVIGSVKTNIGHLESTAGVAGVIKTALALFYRQIPPNLHFEEINPLIVLPDFPMSIPTEVTRWPSEDRRLVAGVSGFSFGGTNVHLVLEEAPSATVYERSGEIGGEESSGLFMLPLSARTPKALKALAREYERFIDHSGEELDAKSLCFTSAVKRSHHDFRLALLGASTRELGQALTTWLGDLDDDRVKDHIVLGKGGHERSVRLVFVYSGQGSHFAGMGRELYEKESVFRESLDNVSRVFEPHLGCVLRDELFATDGVSRINETDCAQPAIFAMQVALTDLWRSWGVSPDAVVGQSLGEVAAAYVAGALSLEDAVSIVAHRSRLMKRTAGRGLTAVIGLSRTDTIAEVDGQGDRVSIAGNSSPTSTVIAGDPQSVESIVRRMQGRDVFARIIENVDVAFHSVQMLPLRDELKSALIEVIPQSTNVAFYSTVTGELCEGTELDAEYWARNLCEPFCFADVVAHLARNGYETFLEISPHSVLSGAVQQSLIRQSIRGEAIPSLTRGMDEHLSIRRALAKVYVEGYNVDWGKQYDGNAKFLSVPGYVWQKERYWIEQIEGGGPRRSVVRTRAAGEHPFVSPGARIELGSGHSVWELELSYSNALYMRDHRIRGAIVVPGAAYVDMALAAALQARPGASVVLEDVHFNRALILADDDVRRMQLVFDPSLPGRATFRVYSKSTSSDLSGGPSDDVDSTAWTEHASSRVVISSQAPARQTVSLADLRASFNEELSAEEHYREMESRQFNFGPAFRPIRRLWRRGVESLSRIELPREAGDTTSHAMHPVVIDAGFQTIAATMSGGSGQTYLPRSIKRVRVAGAAQSQLWCHVRLHEFEAHLDTLTADLTYLNDHGEIVLEIESLTLNRLDATNTETIIADSLFVTRWKPSEQFAATDSSSSKLTRGRFLILADRGGIGEALSVELGRLEHESRVVFSESRSGIEAIVKETALSEGAPLLGVIHLWGLDAGELQGVESLDRANELGPLSILAALRGLIAAGNARTKLWCVTQNGQRPGEGAIEVLQSGLWGMGRALAVEHPELWGGLIDVDSGESKQERVARIISELTTSDDEREVAWRNGVRLVPRLARWEGRRGEGIPVQCRADSSYLVTGGLSGLGLEAAKWLIEQGARRVIVAGRRGVPARTEWQRQVAGSEGWERVESLKELERMGAAIEYWSVDVSSVGEMRQHWEREEAEGRPPIRGIVHAAGVLDDVLAMRMSDESCLRVQDGKVKGALVLDELSRGRGLDFYISYSSVSGVMGQVGQANYGAANAYLDGLMAKRRERGDTGLSIAWGPWAEVGMSARRGAHSNEHDGLRPITPEMGRAILQRVFHADEDSVVALSADVRKLRRSSLLADLRDVESGGTKGIEEGVARGMLLDLLLASPEAKREMLEAALREVVGRVLRSEPAQLNFRKPLPNLGLDSIMAVELKSAIEEKVGLSVSMADLFTASMAQLSERLESQLENDERLARALEEIEQLSLDEVTSLLDERTPQDEAAEV